MRREKKRKEEKRKEEKRSTKILRRKRRKIFGKLRFSSNIKTGEKK